MWIFQSDGDYVNFNGGGNLWRLHSDSKCIEWFWGEGGDLFFDVYDQKYQVKAENIADVVIDGVPLTQAADFATAIIAIFPSLGGGSSPAGSVLSATVELTDAQIKALPTTPINVVAAQGAGKVIQFIAAYIRTGICLDDYANIDGFGLMWLQHQSGAKQISSYISEAVLGSITVLLQGSPAGSSAWFYPYLYVDGTFTYSEAMYTPSGITNKPLQLQCDNGASGNYTGGNAANTFKVTVYYVVVDL